MHEVTYAFIGGITIAFATTIMLYYNGKITGISGIFGNIVELFNGQKSSDQVWRYLFVLGLIIGGVLMKFITPQFFEYKFNFSYLETILAGLLVGVGTRMGYGCTSGHGVCGIARLSKRSIVATLTFMGAGILTVILRGLV